MQCRHTSRSVHARTLQITGAIIAIRGALPQEVRQALLQLTTKIRNMGGTGSRRPCAPPTPAATSTRPPAALSPRPQSVRPLRTLTTPASPRTDPRRCVPRWPGQVLQSGLQRDRHRQPPGVPGTTRHLVPERALAAGLPGEPRPADRPLLGWLLSTIAVLAFARLARSSPSP